MGSDRMNRPRSIRSTRARSRRSRNRVAADSRPSWVRAVAHRRVVPPAPRHQWTERSPEAGRLGVLRRQRVRRSDRVLASSGVVAPGFGFDHLTMTALVAWTVALRRWRATRPVVDTLAVTTAGAGGRLVAVEAGLQHARRTIIRVPLVGAGYAAVGRRPAGSRRAYTIEWPCGASASRLREPVARCGMSSRQAFYAYAAIYLALGQWLNLKPRSVDAIRDRPSD